MPQNSPAAAAAASKSSHPVRVVASSMMNSCDAAAICESWPVKRARTHLRGSSSPGWVMLDCHVRRMREHDFFGATVAEDFTSNGDRISVAFKPSAPPGISRLLFDWHPRRRQRQRQQADNDSIYDDDRGSKSDMDDLRVYQDTQVMAAHRDSILLCLFVPTTTNNLLPPSFSVSFREEHFVYQPARAVPLTALGPCGHDIVNNVGRSNIGILCRGDRDFVVAHVTVDQLEDDDGSGGLLTSACPVTAQLCRYSSGSGSWCTGWLPIRHAQDEGRDLLWWETDFVVSCGEYICWVDYLRGILLCDVFCSVPELHYVRLPINPHQGYAEHDYGLHSYRSVCTTKDGVIKFVDVASSRFWFSRNLQHPSAYPFSITSWTLSSDGRLTWVKDATLDGEDFFSLASNAGLPSSIIPEFPLVDMEDPNIIYFTLPEDRGCNGKAVLVALNMSRKTLELKTSYTLTSTFLRGEYGDDSDTTSCNLFCNEPFLTCEFSNYLNLNLGVTGARE